MVAPAGRIRRALAAVTTAVVTMLAAGQLRAHGLNSSQIRLRLDGAEVSGEWEIAVADARKGVGLDPLVTGEAAGRELQAKESGLRARVARDVALEADGVACALAVDDAVIWPVGAGNLLLRFSARCPAAPRRLRVSCNLLFDADAKHRIYYAVEDARVTHVGLFASGQLVATIDVRAFELWSGFAEFVGEGVWHIWGGLDHLLFLVALLLPAPLVLAGEGWAPRPGGLGPAIREVVKIVSAFTLAHSLTLGVSFFGLVTLPARWVEVAIAVSVFAAAWNNLRRFLPGRAWLMAFAFGLVHGLGFAGALRNLSIPTRARGVALAAFNVGVELGQLAIVAANPAGMM